MNEECEWLKQQRLSHERINALVFTIGNKQFTPAQARAILPDIVGFINHHGAMDDYTERIEKRVDPAHECVWHLLDTAFGTDGPFALLRCTWCGKELRLRLEHCASTDTEMWRLAKRATGLDRYALHDRYDEFCKKMIEIFGDD